MDLVNDSANIIVNNYIPDTSINNSFYYTY